MEIAKRTAHMSASLGGFKRVDPFDKVFPSRKKPRTARKSDFGRFFRGISGPNKKKD
jgi:hypothetical protein